MTDAGLKELAALKGLKKLNLFAAKVTDQGLTELAKIRSLRQLDVRETNVTDTGLTQFGLAADCESGSLNRPPVAGRCGWPAVVARRLWKNHVFRRNLEGMGAGSVGPTGPC